MFKSVVPETQQPAASDVVSAPIALADHHAALREIFFYFCGSGLASLSLARWLAFLDGFDVCPGYLTEECCEEVHSDALQRNRSGGRGGGARAGLSFADFQDAMCHLAKAVAEKQWMVEYAA